MSIIIREADLQRDRQAMMACLLRNRERYEANETFVRRFDWAYHDNPHGAGKIWLAVETAGERVIGFTSAFPRKVIVNGETLTGWNCADFSIDKEYRTLGVAIKLRRAAKDCVDRGEFAFLYAHPNDRMRVVHEKVGHHAIGKMVRYAALLRLDRLSSLVLGNNMLARVLAGLVNPFLRLLTRGHTGDGTCRFRLLQEERFGPEYDRLFERVKLQHSVIASRDTAYLNWRFLDNPLHRAKSFRMEDGGELKGYVLYFEGRGVAHVADLLVDGRSEEMRLLLAGLIHHLRKAGFSTISLRLHNMNPVLAQAQQLGFRYRNDATSTVIAYAAPASPYASVLLEGKNWFMTVGDRDI
ncbi:MAG: GNAT family N-acetyltransferase [candidate division KSB1 bacterium]|nr:GNAT family N-acetyltransferase [candidate division KSB1 bacterium]MDZ7272764.1 GNAT family N-acetyltransferase [candidate division KSB1 bacterium]MDZ7284212.1 GNAT family N-acetyltransferase [candidate division KSB1 bacterium]MDZ7297390.1 GNAT family N-acetyltransferase [candidate division KSB1 bacterium]MDZ7306550.1 GNAT family N-acetyltransferase [candidate division KSB1 bacterium]